MSSLINVEAKIRVALEKCQSVDEKINLLMAGANSDSIGKIVGEIPQDISEEVSKTTPMPPAPIVLYNGVKKHIAEGHAKELKTLGMDAENYVNSILENTEAIYSTGKLNSFDLVCHKRGKNDRLVIRLEKAGDKYKITTATPLEPRHLKNKMPLWEGTANLILAKDGGTRLAVNSDKVTTEKNLPLSDLDVNKKVKDICVGSHIRIYDQQLEVIDEIPWYKAYSHKEFHENFRDPSPKYAIGYAMGIAIQYKRYYTVSVQSVRGGWGHTVARWVVTGLPECSFKSAPGGYLVTPQGKVYEVQRFNTFGCPKLEHDDCIPLSQIQRDNHPEIHAEKIADIESRIQKCLHDDWFISSPHDLKLKNTSFSLSKRELKACRELAYYDCVSTEPRIKELFAKLSSRIDFYEEICGWLKAIWKVNYTDKGLRIPRDKYLYPYQEAIEILEEKLKDVYAQLKEYNFEVSLAPLMQIPENILQECYKKVENN